MKTTFIEYYTDYKYESNLFNLKPNNFIHFFYLYLFTNLYTY